MGARKGGGTPRKESTTQGLNNQDRGARKPWITPRRRGLKVGLAPEPSTKHKEPARRMGWAIRERIEDLRNQGLEEELTPEASKEPGIKNLASEKNRKEPSGTGDP